MNSTVQTLTPIIERNACKVARPDLLETQGFAHWQATLTLHLKKTARGTVVKHSLHKGPLYIQKAFYPEGRDLAHIYIPPLFLCVRYVAFHLSLCSQRKSFHRCLLQHGFLVAADCSWR